MNLKIKIILFIFITLWVFGIFIQLFIPLQNNLTYLFPFLDRIYSTVCHQQSQKLVEINGHHTLVCGRCTGIYIGGLLTAFILLFVSKVNFKDAKLMLVASVPMLIDVIFYSNGFYNYNINIALATGLFFGFVGIAYIYNGLQIIVERNGKSK